MCIYINIYAYVYKYDGCLELSPRLSGVSPRHESVGDKNLRSRCAFEGEVFSDDVALPGAAEDRNGEKS